MGEGAKPIKIMGGLIAYEHALVSLCCYRLPSTYLKMYEFSANYNFGIIFSRDVWCVLHRSSFRWSWRGSSMSSAGSCLGLITALPKSVLKCSLTFFCTDNSSCPWDQRLLVGAQRYRALVSYSEFKYRTTESRYVLLVCKESCLERFAEMHSTVSFNWY